MKKVTAVLALFLLLLTNVAILLAHGGGQLIAGPVQAGPYMLSVWVNPPQPRAGEVLHYTVGVAAPEDSAPVLDAKILITMQPVGQDSSPVMAEATTDQSVNRLFYETDMLVEADGPYVAQFEVSGPEGNGQLSVDVQVKAHSSFNWFWLGLAGLAAVLVLGWTQNRRRIETT